MAGDGTGSGTNGADGVPASSAGGRRLVVVANPATKGDVQAIIALLRRHAPAGVSLDIRLTSAPGAAAELARAALGEAWTVVAVGGDGTVADVASALRGSAVPLGIIPAGSTNIIARELGIPTKPRAAVALLFGPHAHARLDVGLCGERAFLHMAGAGLDSRLFANANPAWKRRVGWLAYVPAAARAILQQPARFAIVADGTRHEVVSPLVIVANGRSIIAPWLPLFPDLHKDDGWLDVLIFTARAPIPVARTLARLATRSLDRSPFVTRLRARRVELDADPPLAVELDGDVVERTPVSFEILPGALAVIVPAAERP